MPTTCCRVLHWEDPLRPRLFCMAKGTSVSLEQLSNFQGEAGVGRDMPSFSPVGCCTCAPLLQGALEVTSQLPCEPQPLLQESVWGQTRDMSIGGSPAPEKCVLVDIWPSNGSSWVHLSLAGREHRKAGYGLTLCSLSGWVCDVRAGPAQMVTCTRGYLEISLKYRF